MERSLSTTDVGSVMGSFSTPLLNSLLNLASVRVDGIRKCERNLFFMSFLFIQGEVAASKSLVTCTVFVMWPFNAITIFQSSFLLTSSYQ